MGISAAMALKALSAVSAVSSIVGGVQGMGAGNEMAQIALMQSQATAAERQRLAEREARFEQENINDTIRRQKIAYMKSGVTLEGSPLLVMEETRAKGADNISEILTAGQAGATAAQMEGRIQATQATSAGRSAFISGFGSAANSLATGFLR